MFLIMNVLRSSPAFLVCLNTSSTDLQLDFINVTKVMEKPRDFDPFGHAGFAHLWLQYD